MRRRARRRADRAPSCAPAVSPWARLCAASRSAWLAAPPAWLAAPSSSASCAGELLLLLGRHLVDLVARASFEVLLGLLRVAVRVGLGLAGRGPRQAAAERRQRRGALLVRRVELGAHAASIEPSLARLASSSSGFRAAAGRGRAAPWRAGFADRRRRRPFLELLGQLVEALGLGLRLLADLRAWAIDRVLRVRDEHDRARAASTRHEGHDRGPAREARPEQVRGRARSAARGRAAGGGRSGRLGGLVDRRRPSPAIVVRGPSVGAGRRRGRERDGERQRARGAVAEPPSGSTAIAVSPRDGRALDDRDEQGERADDRDARQPTAGADSSGQEPGEGPEDELGDEHRGEHDPGAAHDAPQPQAPPVRARAPERTARRSGSSGPSIATRGSTGTNGGVGLHRRIARRGTGAEPVMLGHSCACADAAGWDASGASG